MVRQEIKQNEKSINNITKNFVLLIFLKSVKSCFLRFIVILLKQDRNLTFIDKFYGPILFII